MVSVCLPVMPSCNTYHLTWVSLTLGVGYLFTAAPAKHGRCSLPWMRGMSSRHPSWPSAWDGSSRPSCARTAPTPWAWGCPSRPPPWPRAWGCSFLLPPLASEAGWLLSAVPAAVAACRLKMSRGGRKSHWGLSTTVRKPPELHNLLISYYGPMRGKALDMYSLNPHNNPEKQVLLWLLLFERWKDLCKFSFILLIEWIILISFQMLNCNPGQTRLVQHALHLLCVSGFYLLVLD